VKVALWGLFGLGNHGNEATLAATLSNLARIAPEIDPVVVCPDPLRVTDEHSVPAVATDLDVRLDRPRLPRMLVRPGVEAARWFATYRFLRRVDALVVPGTGILDDFGQAPRELPYDLWRWCLTARIARRPVVFVGVGAGPIENPLSRRLFRAAVACAASCSYRDDTSRRFMASIGRDVAADGVVPDLVFGLRHQPVPAVSTPSPGRVGVGVMAYYGWRNLAGTGQATLESHTANLTDVVESMIADGHDVRLLIGEDTDRTAAEMVIRLVSERLGSQVVVERLIYEPVANLEELIEQIGETDVVVTTRFHNVVAALMARRPVVSIGYSSKNRDLLASVGLGAYCHDVDTVDVAAVIEDCRSAFARRRELSASLDERVVGFADAVARAFDRLATDLSGAGRQ
jgi:polysaccharide pyruvyl transferase WcaK-like protein